MFSLQSASWVSLWLSLISFSENHQRFRGVAAGHTLQLFFFLILSESSDLFLSFPSRSFYQQHRLLAISLSVLLWQLFQLVHLLCVRGDALTCSEKKRQKKKNNPYITEKNWTENMCDSIFNVFWWSTHHGNTLLSATADRSLHNMSRRDIKGNVGAPFLRSDVQGQTLTSAVTDICNSHK